MCSVPCGRSKMLWQKVRGAVLDHFSGEGPAQALRKAMLSFVDDGELIRRWSGLVMVGPGRPLTKVVVARRHLSRCPFPLAQFANRFNGLRPCFPAHSSCPPNLQTCYPERRWLVPFRVMGLQNSNQASRT